MEGRAVRNGCVTLVPPLDNRREFCIGKGAHQHYWDGTAPQIALELDALIRG